jgi:catechol 2,3-dioxygenase-like lactoylglutathione lyase family enzyme
MPKTIAELALRVNDLKAMTAFYVDVVGLEMFSDNSPDFVFLKVSDLADGHPQIMGFFDRSSAVGQDTSTLDHFAFVIDLADHDSEKARLEALGVPIALREFPNFHWRSIFFADPEGNTIELVSYDPSVG